MKVREALKHLAADAKRALPSLKIDPTEYADTLFGVGSATSAGPTLPAGSIHPSPETLEKDCGGYLREQPIIGFGHAYISGAGGVKCYGNYLLAPTVCGLELDGAARASFAKPGTEIGRCYEYSVELENGIKVKSTPHHNSAIHEISYPEGDNRALILDVAHKLDMDECMRFGSITVNSERKEISGGGRYFGNWNRIDWDMYFAMRFDADVSEIGIFRGAEAIPANKPESFNIDSPCRFGAYLKFADGAPKTVRVKVAISFVSEAKAIEHLEREIAEFDYDYVKEHAKNAWRDTMSVIELDSLDGDLLKRFYTAMYHMNIQPRDRRDDHGLWDDFHTIWDSWKTVFPMYSLLYPDKMSAIIESFVDRANKNAKEGNGIVIADEFMTAKEFLAGQGGNDIDNAIVDAYLKGIKLDRYEWEDVYRVLLDSAEKMRSPEYVTRGFATDNRVTVTGKPYTIRFKSAAATMGFAFNDKAVARMALELGTKDEYEKYENRSANWLNVWNCDLTSEGFTGFPQSPREDGSFPEGFDAHGGYNKDFYEATSWDASYINYNDLDRLIEAMGGAEKFTERLLFACEHSVNYYNDDEGAEGYLNFTNEPSFHIPWLFCTEKIRRPDLAAQVIDGIIARYSVLNDYPGDDDNGAMSSYYVFLMCGFFPYSTTEKYYLHGTRVEKILFRLGCGNDFSVTGENVKPGNIYVQSATWKGEPLDRCWLTHKEILEGGELHFVMGSEPSDWAKK